MIGRSFFDTNLLVYTDDLDAPEKQERALSLWQDHRLAGMAVISIQVLQEYYWATTRKLGVDPAIATEKMTLFARADVMVPQADDVLVGARLSVEHKLSFWDAMIVHMAVQSDCEFLFSEDLQAGRRFAGVEVANPFL
jgi:predicted nucleic acid-binding protein